MILDRLVLHNFKRFRDAEIQFKDGITGILGNNGTGKSSLISAVFFALYGIRATGIAADYIVSSFAGPREKCEVRLDFRIGGDSYTVLRSFKKAKSTTHDAEFYKNKKLVAKEVSPVEDAVTRTLGMGPTDFKNTIYAAQKDLLTLLENTPGKRKEWFQKALGIDYLKTGSDKTLKEQVEAKSGELQRKEGELAALAGRVSDEDLAKLEASAAASRTAIAEHTKAKEAKAKEREELGQKQKVLDEKILAYNRLMEQHRNATKELDADKGQAGRLEAQIALLAAEEAEYQKLEKTAASYDDVTKRLAALRAKKEAFLQKNAELGFAKVQAADLTSRAGKLREQVIRCDKDLAERDTIVAAIHEGLGAGGIAEDRIEGAVSFRLAEIGRREGTLATQIAGYAQERSQILSDQKTIRDAGADGVCPLCRQKLGDHFGSIDAEFSTRIHELEEKSAADRARQEKLAKEKAAVEGLKPLLEKLRGLQEKSRQRTVYAEDLANLEAKVAAKAGEQRTIEEALAHLAYNEEEFRACEKESAGLEKVRHRVTELATMIAQGQAARQHLAGINEKIGQRTAEIERLAGEIKAAAFDPAESVQLTMAIATADRALRDEDVLIANANADLRFTEEKIAEFHKAAAQVKALEQQAAGLKEEIDLVKLTRSLISEYVVWLMQVVRTRIEEETGRILGEITGGRYEQVLLDEDFNLLVRDIDNDYPVDRFSGGEQDDIAVALRIALSRYLAELHDVHESTVLIFDEIFGSQDEERRVNLLTALRTQESRFPQILLISHIAEIQGEFANTLVVETGSDAGSRVREAE